MQQTLMDAPVTRENFEEGAYLNANPDVKAAVLAGTCASGRVHFEQIGWREGRRTRPRSNVTEMRRSKMERVRAFLRQDMRFTVDIESGGKFN